MRIFDQANSAEVVTFRIGPMTLVFCGALCRIDYRNGVRRRLEVADRNLYGCWQCGEDLVQGLSLDFGEEDSSVYRKRRQR